MGTLDCLTGPLKLSTRFAKGNTMDLLILTAVQALVGGFLAIHLINLPHPKKLKHRCVALGFAALGSVTLSSALVYLPSFSLCRFLIMTSVSCVSILLLNYFKWDVRKLCKVVGQ